MNFQTVVFMPPVRVMMINPLIPASQLTITKILSGVVFGRTQLIDLILLVYANEVDVAQDLAHELTGCAFKCYNTIKVTSDLPCLSDADVFCFITSFPNPNSFEFENMDSTEQFDNVYLIAKIATSFAKPEPVKEPTLNLRKKVTEPVKAPRKPIIFGDGVLVIDIIKTIAPNLPNEALFGATPLMSIAKITLSDYLKVRCFELNDAYVWAANDLVFHAEMEVPYVKNDVVQQETSGCDWNAMSPELYAKLNLEHVSFNASWMKREFIERMLAASSTNPYGSISKAAEISRTLKSIWLPRSIENATDSKISVYVISDGSLGTIKGVPYVLPVTITEHSWTVNQKYEDTSHLRHEIKRINAAALEHHKKLVSYCKKFHLENIINKSFIPMLDSETSSFISTKDDSNSTVIADDEIIN